MEVFENEQMPIRKEGEGGSKLGNLERTYFLNVLISVFHSFVERAGERTYCCFAFTRVLMTLKVLVYLLCKASTSKRRLIHAPSLQNTHHLDDIVNLFKGKKLFNTSYFRF